MTQPAWNDPQIHIASATGKSVSPYYDICDFVPSTMEEEVIIGGNGEQNIVVKSGPKKPHLENITLSQWSVANMAILYKLLGEGKLQGTALLDYLSHTTKIYQFIQRYSVPSVFQYDRECRKLQAAMGFRWGTDVQHLHKLHLIPREKANTGTAIVGRKQPITGKPKGEKREAGICRNFNSKKGCTYPACRFRHQCILSGCNLPHAATTHVSEKKLNIEVKPLPGLSLAAWCEELGNDPDREFILSSIENGFDIIDDNAEFAPVNCDNHPTARPGSPLYGAATSQIIKEIECGNYIICDEVPKIVSPMGVIPKPDGDVRLIHDCSRPVGKAVNDYCNVNWHQKFARVDDAAKFMSPGCYFAKVDLRSAYRSVNLSKASQEVTGLKWVLNGETVYLRDSKLPFGAKLSPGIFHRLTQAVKRIMARKGFDLLVVYLDDFFGNFRL